MTTTTTTSAPAGQAGATPKTAPRRPCGFCSTGHHVLCPATIRNGSAVKDKTWTCICHERDHTLGKQPPVRMEIIRLSPATRALLGEIRDSRAARTAEATPARRAPAETSASDGSLHTHCERCGWDFGQAIPQARCGSQRMCDRRVQLGDPTFGRRKARK